MTYAAKLGRSADDRSGSPIDQFVNTLREVDLEYGRSEIGATAAMAEVRAALRQLDRNHENRGKRA